MWILDLALIELNAVSMMTSSKQQDIFALFQEINHQIQCNHNSDQKQLSSSKSNLCLLITIIMMIIIVIIIIMMMIIIILIVLI